MKAMTDPLAVPSSLTILGTYTCTAQCRECCFECSPSIKGRLSLEQITTRIDKMHAAFPACKLVCFSGGECFLLGKDLDKSIAYANGLNLVTRCVSNGYWASSPERAKKRLQPMAEAGLKELNLSTGDEHQRFVPFDSIVNAGIEAAEAGIRTVIVIEGSQEAIFRKEKLVAHPHLQKFLANSEYRSNLFFIENIWMSFHEDSQYTHADDIYAKSSGCPNILDNLVATPSGQMASCCGLTMEYIPEMKLGDGDKKSFLDMHEAQLSDFMKVWLAVDGPKKILQFAVERNPSIHLQHAAHSCEACVISTNGKMSKIHCAPIVRKL